LIQRVIPQSDTYELDAALKALWEVLVEKVAGAGTQPVSFAVDWDIFRDKIEDSLSRTGYARYVNWYGSFGPTPMPKEEASDGDYGEEASDGDYEEEASDGDYE
jgi:hypothetical protein